MYKHQTFDLFIYTQSEIEHLIGKPVRKMQLLREWPLSSVHEIECTDGSLWVAKYMREPLNIEGDFYSQVQGSFVLPCNHIINHPPHLTLVYEKVQGVHPNQLNLTESEALGLLNKVQSQIRTLNHLNLPVRITIDTPDTFVSRFEETVSHLKQLINSGKFTRCNQTTWQIVEQIISDHDIVQKLTENVGYAHGDLGADNILCLPDETFLIMDWQRSIRGSYLIDQYIFMESMGLNPLHYLPIEAFYLANLERIDWYVSTSVRWFPSATMRYDEFIYPLAEKLISVYPAKTTKLRV